MFILGSRKIVTVLYTLVQLTTVVLTYSLTQNPRARRVSLSYSVAAHVHTGVTKTGESAPSGDCGTVCRTNSNAVIHTVRHTNSKSLK